MNKFALLALTTICVALTVGCATAVDTEAQVQGARTGFFLTVLSIDGAPVAGTVTATVANSDNAGAGYTEHLDVNGLTFLPLRVGEWVFSVRDTDGKLLDCDPIPAVITEEVGVVNVSVTCDTGPQN